jgi:hypothetical protein
MDTLVAEALRTAAPDATIEPAFSLTVGMPTRTSIASTC